MFTESVMGCFLIDIFEWLFFLPIKSLVHICTVQIISGGFHDLHVCLNRLNPLVADDEMVFTFWCFRTVDVK